MTSRSRARSGRRNLIVAIGAAAAMAATGGLASANEGAGGVDAPNPPALNDVACVEKCAAVRRATFGSKVQLVGRNLSYVRKVKFNGDRGRITVRPAQVGKKAIEAEVPNGAVKGKPRVIDEYGEVATSPKGLEIVPESELPRGGEFKVTEASVTPAKAFFYGTAKPTLGYLFAAAGPTDVRIDLVDRGDGSVVRSWVQEDAAANSAQQLAWDGRTEDGKSAPSGRYKFRIGPPAGPLSDVGHATYFGFYDHIFPIRGKHSYGDGLGAARSGHSHQGQDVFAECGKRLVAARGGRVQYEGYQGGGAGYYVVIDGKRTGRDYAYMHLRRKALVSEGDRVRTGEKIGEVGESGNASGCHLHFELWSKPGWYEGGRFLNATPQLRKWDRWS